MPRLVVGVAEAEARRVRSVSVAAFEEARARNWPFLSDVLERALRNVAEEDRAVVTATVHALVKYDRLLAFATETDDGGARFDALFTIPEAGPLDERIARIERRVERIGVTFSFPDGLVTLIEDDVGQSAAPGALARMNETAPRVARVNLLKTTRDACVAALAEEGVATAAPSLAPWAIGIDGRRSVYRTNAFSRGDFEMQDESSQAVVELVAPPPGSIVVDACAGAGGKTLALAAALGGKGRVVAIDVGDTKLDELRRRARRAGASNVQALSIDLASPGDGLAPLLGRAARVLVDAPCTGLGAIRRNPEVRWRLDAAQVASLGRAQAGLLRAAAPLVAPRGRLIFATCSFLRREGEEVFERFLAEDPRFGLVTARDVLGRTRAAPIATPDGKYLRTWRFDPPSVPDAPPVAREAVHEHSGDGFFAGVARLLVEPKPA